MWLKTQTLLENKNLSGHQGFHEEYQMCLCLKTVLGFFGKLQGLGASLGPGPTWPIAEGFQPLLKKMAFPEIRHYSKFSHLSSHLVFLTTPQSGWSYLQFMNEEPGASPGEPAQAHTGNTGQNQSQPHSLPKEQTTADPLTSSL